MTYGLALRRIPNQLSLSVLGFPTAPMIPAMPPARFTGPMITRAKSGKKPIISLPLGSGSDALARRAIHMASTVRPMRVHPTTPKMIDTQFTFRVTGL